MAKAPAIITTTNVLVSGDPMNPHESDLIAQVGILKVGLLVPGGWRVLTGNEKHSRVARLAYRHDIENDIASGKVS